MQCITKNREQTEVWLNNFTNFSNAVFVTLHYKDTLQDKTFNTKQRIQKANKRLFRNFEKILFKRQKDRLKRIVITETKLTSRNHLHMVIQIPENETYETFIAKLWVAVNKTNETLENTLDTKQIYDTKNLINYLTKESNYNIDNFDVLNSRF